MATPTRIHNRSSVQDVREVVGYDDATWGAFLESTRQAAREFVNQNPDVSRWGAVKPIQYKPLFAQLQEQLRKEGFNPVSEDILRWRMSQAVNSVLRQTRENRGKQQSGKASAISTQTSAGPQLANSSEQSAPQPPATDLVLPSINELFRLADP